MANADAVIAGRNFRVYSAPWLDTNEPPADTIDYGEAWGSPYETRGYTIGGLQMSMNIDRSEIRVDQEFDPVFQPITSRNVQLSTELAEITPENLQIASGLGELDSEAPGASARGHNDLIISAAVTESFRTWGYDILQPDGMPFRIIVWKGLATGTPSPQFTPDNAATVALEVSAMVDTSTTPSRIALVRDVVAATGGGD